MIVDPGHQFFSGKNFTSGFPCTYRNHRAESHCRFLHGYDLSFKFEFSTTQLDVRNWVVDFGGLKELKAWLEKMFDHTTLVAEDDPLLEHFRNLEILGVIDMRVVPNTGCEAFAYMAYQYAEQWIKDAGFGPRCSLDFVEVRENEKNFARYGKR